MAHRVIIIIYSDIYGQFPALTHFKESYKFPEKDCLKLGQLFEPLEVKKNEHLLRCCWCSSINIFLP